MTEINPNLENRNIYSAQNKAVQDSDVQPKVRIPRYYMPETKSAGFADSLKENPLYSVGVDGFFGPFFEHPIASGATLIGCSYLLDKYTDACSGEYEKSLLKRAANFGDRIENSRFIQSKPVKGALNGISAGFSSLSKFLRKSSVIRAIMDHPTRPEWEICLSEMLSQ